MLGLIVAGGLFAGCQFLRKDPADLAQLPHQRYVMEVTGYCHCGKCCGWKRNWYGRPVYSAGPLKGKPKKVGITASGKKVRLGTIAADTRLFPFGTIMYVPGYGYGRVEDRGKDIVGYRLDLYFHSHAQADAWGRQRLEVKVWRPGAAPSRTKAIR